MLSIRKEDLAAIRVMHFLIFLAGTSAFPPPSFQHDQPMDISSVPATGKHLPDMIS
jgi:hypothetical protein